MEKFTNEELLEVLPVAVRETKELTKKQKVVLGQLMILNGLDKKDEEGFFFRSNRDLCADCDVEEKTLISAIRKLVYLGLIETKRGSRRTGASYYKVLEDAIMDYSKTNTGNYSDNYSNEVLGMADRIKELEITVKNLNRNYSKNYSTDIEEDLDINKDIDILINNILRYTSKETLKDKLKTILEETQREKELEEQEAESAIPVTQPVQTDSLASTPSENEFLASPVTKQGTPAEETHTLVDGNSTPMEELHTPEVTQTSTEAEVTPVEHKPIPDDDERYQSWILALEPFFDEYEKASTVSELESLMNKTKQALWSYENLHQFNDDSLTWKVAGVVAEKYTNHKDRIQTKLQQMAKVFKFQSSQLN